MGWTLQQIFHAWKVYIFYIFILQKVVYSRTQQTLSTSSSSWRFFYESHLFVETVFAILVKDCQRIGCCESEFAGIEAKMMFFSKIFLQFWYIIFIAVDDNRYILISWGISAQSYKQKVQHCILFLSQNKGSQEFIFSFETGRRPRTHKNYGN